MHDDDDFHPRRDGMDTSVEGQTIILYNNISNHLYIHTYIDFLCFYFCSQHCRIILW